MHHRVRGRSVRLLGVAVALGLGLAVGPVPPGVAAGAPGAVSAPLGVGASTAASLSAVVGSGEYQPVSRVAGADRYATAAAVSRSFVHQHQSSVFIASGEGFADALAAGAAAAREGAPLLLTKKDRLPAATAAELRRIGAQKVIVVGGPGAVSPAVVTALETGGRYVQQAAGADRYVTAADLSRLWLGAKVPVAYVVSGESPADALSAGAAAGAQGGPVLLTRAASLPAATAEALAALKPARIAVVGGTGAVSSAVATRLQGLTTGTVTRLAGSDRYSTSAAVATATSSPGARVAYLVDGSGYADALAAASPAALQRGPVLLTRTASVPGPVATALTTLKPRRIVGLGGPAVVSDATLDSVRGLTRRGKAAHLGSSPAGAHRCLVTTTGGVECWGENLEGQLGNGTRSNAAVPVPVAGLQDVTTVGNGFHHSCAVSAGEVWCWGDNSLGQLGRAPGQPSTVPVRVTGLGTVTALAVGTEFTCALGDDKTVRCWGDNLAGQLGFPATVEPHAAPRAVPGLEADVVQLTAGGSFACAILGSGSVRCWGDNWKGQSGADPAVAEVVPATTVALSGPAASVRLGNSHACAVLSAGGVRCWGYGDDGRLGDGKLTSSWVPVTPVGLGTATGALATAVATCLYGDGIPVCWGAGSAGWFAPGVTGPVLPTAQPQLGSGMVELEPVGYTMCQLDAAGAVRCQGTIAPFGWPTGPGETVPTPTRVTGF